MSNDKCGLCDGEIGPDITGRPMCYGCGPSEMKPKARHLYDLALEAAGEVHDAYCYSDTCKNVCRALHDAIEENKP